MDEQLRQAVLAFEPLWDKRGLELDIDLDEVKLTSGAELLDVVWNNLISNAVKFSEPGGLLRAALRREDGQAVVRIQDSGCGMDTETQAVYLIQHREQT